jgi:hypothetical protein
MGCGKMKKWCRVLRLVAAAVMFAARFPYAGVNFSVEGDWKRSLALLREAGFSRIRVPLSWEALEGTPGKISADWVDSVVKEARLLGLDVTGVVGLENAVYPEANRASARLNFVATLARRFRGLIGTYEIGDDVDVGAVLATGLEPSPANLARAYATMFAPVAAVIRYQDPGARVLVGSFDPHNEVFFAVLQEMGVVQASDGVSLALRFTREALESAEAWRGLQTRLSAVQGALGRGQVLTAGWVTISGERSANERAALMARLAVTLPALGFDAYHFSPMRDLRDDLLSGLLGPGEVPRPAYVLLRNLFAVISEWRPMPAPFRYQLSFPQMFAGRFGFVYYGNGAEGGVIYWNPGQGADGLFSLAPRSYFIYQIIDPIGTTQTKMSPETTPDGWLLKNVPASDHPRIIRIRNTEYAFLYPPDEEAAPVSINLP